MFFKRFEIVLFVSLLFASWVLGAPVDGAKGEATTPAQIPNKVSHEDTKPGHILAADPSNYEENKVDGEKTKVCVTFIPGCKHI
jgi:hypothetical protein